MVRGYRFFPGLLLAVLVFFLIQARGIDAHEARQATVWPAINLVQLPNAPVSSPVHLTHAGDGSGRLFIVEQDGRIRIYQSSTLSLFLDIDDRVLSNGEAGAGSEEGLLSVAFPPDYTGMGYFYVYYTNLDGNNQVSRFRRSNGNANQANPNSEVRVLLLNHPVEWNHNGGQMAFGPDGYLYIGTGDGGGGGDLNNNAQNPASLLGKILRIDPYGAVAPNLSGLDTVYLPLQFAQGAALGPYRIPADNPLVGVSGARPEIWALGLRNPWRFGFDRQTGALYIGDVGQGEWEEIDYQPPIAQGGGGENYGWRVMEGKHCYNSATCNQAGLTLPVWEYSHSVGGCSITGGFVYRGAAYPALQGIYVYADYCSGKIWGLARNGGAWENHLFTPTQNHISSFGEDQNGELYAVDKDGAIYRVVVP